MELLVVTVVFSPGNSLQLSYCTSCAAAAVEQVVAVGQDITGETRQGISLVPVEQGKQPVRHISQHISDIAGISNTMNTQNIISDTVNSRHNIFQKLTNQKHCHTTHI